MIGIESVNLNYRNWIIALIVVVAITIGGGSYYRQQNRAAWDADVLSELRASYPDQKQETALAKIYWSKHPNVMSDAYFGKDGRLGIYGARQHFRKHGKNEGKNWP